MSMEIKKYQRGQHNADSNETVMIPFEILPLKKKLVSQNSNILKAKIHLPFTF